MYCLDKFLTYFFGEILVIEITRKELIQMKKRKCMIDIWGAFMVEDALFGKYDIPLCPTTTISIPREIITWPEAKSIYKKNKHTPNFKYPAFVCFYTDDYLFDGRLGIWVMPYRAKKILEHFEGVITPDFSTFQDFPIAIQIYATYRMRAFGYWLGKSGISVINNVRGGLPKTYDFCFEGIPKNSIVAIGTVGGNPRKLADRERFNEWIFIMIERLNPHTIIVYGSSNYPCFDKIKQMGIRVVTFKSRTARAFDKRRGTHE